MSSRAAYDSVSRRFFHRVVIRMSEGCAAAMTRGADGKFAGIECVQFKLLVRIFSV
jgi:hypothetical protein